MEKKINWMDRIMIVMFKFGIVAAVLVFILFLYFIVVAVGGGSK